MDDNIIVKDGWKYIGFFFMLTLIGFLVKHGYVIYVPSLLLLLFVSWFFRNPERNVPEGDIIVSPADGTVIKIDKNNKYEQFMGKDAVCVSIFMSIFNVHVNRSPVSGTVVDKQYKPGKFHIASVDKASDFNEQTALFIKDDKGRKLVVVQIAGSVARRIVCNVEKGSNVTMGKRYGMIKLGSRLDVYIEPDREIMVHKGDKVKAGETIIAK
ncbi:MAG: phosphatidylserine decarboxylase family protein [bacterium]